MALTSQIIADALFKKLQRKSSTNDGRQFFEEPRNAGAAVYQAQIWAQSDQIPATAPTGLTDQQIQGVVQYWQDLVLTAVPGTTNSFYSDSLVQAIPFNYGDGSSYNYTVKDSTGAVIPFGQGDWLVDPDTGVITFYTSTPSNMPPKISFFKYVGTLGALSSLADALTLKDQATNPSAPAAGQVKVFANAAGKVLQMLPDGSTKALGGGGGASGKNYLADLYDGSSVTGINQFAQGANYSFNSSSNYVDTLGYAINYLGGGLFFTGQPVVYSAGTTAITGLVNGTTYYAVRISSTAFGLASTQFNANAKVLLPLTSQGVGTQGFAFQNQFGIGSGGIVAGLTTSVNTSSPLRSSGNQRLAKDAANRQGEGWSYDFTADAADTDGTKPMKVAFKFRTSANFATGDVVVSLLDLTNNVLVQLDGAFNVNLPAATKTTGYQSIFYPTQGSSAYRLVLTIATTNALAYTVDLVDWELSLIGGSAPGAIATSLTQVGPITITATTTPPTKGTTTTDVMSYGRIGDHAHVTIQFKQTTAGTTGNGDYLIQLPSGLAFDPARTTFYTAIIGAAAIPAPAKIGIVTFDDGSSECTGSVVPYDATRFRIVGVYSAGTSNGRGAWGSGFFQLSNPTTTVSADFLAPISGWSAGAQFSTNDQALKNVPYFTKSADAVPTASGTYPAFTNNGLTLPPGTYDLVGYNQFTFGSGNPLWNQCNAQFGLVNGNNTATVPTAIDTAPDITVYGNSSTNVYMNSQVNFWTANVACTVKLSVTRTIYLNAYQVAGAATGGKITAYFTANKRPDFSAFSVVTDPAPATMFQGNVASNVAMTANTTNLPLTAVKDTDLAWNGTGYVVARDGDYQLGGTQVAGTTNCTLGVWVNGTFKQWAAIFVPPTSSTARSGLSGVITNLKKNDLVQFRYDGNVTAYSFAGDFLTITRVTQPNYTGVYGNVDIRSVTSNVYAGGATATFLALTNNSITLPVGTWRMKTQAWFNNNGTTPNYQATIIGLFAANGANTSTQPAAPWTLTNVVRLSAGPTYQGGTAPTNTFDMATPAQEMILQVTSGSATLYGVGYFQATTPANTQVTTYITAERLQ